MTEKRKLSLSEAENDIDGLDDSDDDMYDDGTLDLDDTSHLTSLCSSLISAEKTNISTTSLNDGFLSHNIRSAFGVSSGPSANTVASSLIFDDSIRSYIEAPSLFQSTKNLSPYYLSIDPNVDQSDSNPLASDKLFVGNIPYKANWRELKKFFVHLNYDVIRVDLPKSHKTVKLFFNTIISFFYLCRQDIVVMPLFNLTPNVLLKMFWEILKKLRQTFYFVVAD
jgi:hypothetical protein